MFESDDEKLLKELYRESMSQQLSRPDIQSAKKELLSEFFSPMPQPVFSWLSPGFLVPAFAILTVAFFFGNLQQRFMQAAGPAIPIYQTFGTIMEEAKIQRAVTAAQARAKADLEAQKREAEIAAEDPVYNHMKPRVQVKRVSSRKGPTMVYQRSYQDVPVTIIWVFTGGGHRS